LEYDSNYVTIWKTVCENSKKKTKQNTKKKRCQGIVEREEFLRH
jgi:hypothetical protein